VRVRDPTTMQGRILEDVARNVDAETVRQPVGVCAAIVPFNFPAMVPFWFLPFAIGCGNAFVLKPSEQVPLTQQIAFEVLDSLGLPPGVVNLVNGGPRGRRGHPRAPRGIDAVSFVGSAPVARIVYERAAPSGKRVQALGGAKNHMVVNARRGDATRPSTGSSARPSAPPASAAWRLGRGHGRRGARQASRPAARGDGVPLRVGRRARGGRDVGPVVSNPRASASAAAIDRRGADGAQILVDGRDAEGDGSVRGPDESRWRPARHERPRGDLRPGAVGHRGDTLDEAIEIVNRAGSATARRSSPSRARGPPLPPRGRGGHGRREHRRRRAGRVLPVQRLEGLFLGDLHAHGPDAVEFYTRKKTVTSRWFSSGQGHGQYFVED
jgi:malonate-semialdehyde dehydrogenase (acetylating)/methylmalonate-semialdehyde dehydrogenase